MRELIIERLHYIYILYTKSIDFLQNFIFYKITNIYIIFY